MADRNGTRKHRWSSPPEVSPNKYLRGLDSKHPRGALYSREQDSDSHSPPRNRHVTLYPYQSTPKLKLDLGVGDNFTERRLGRAHQRTTSLDFPRFDRQEMSTPTSRTSVSMTESDRRSEMDVDTKTKSEDLPRAQARRLQASSLLFKRAFSDILGNSTRRSLDGQLTEAERTIRFQRRESMDSEPSPTTDTPQKKIMEEKSSRRLESGEHPIRLRRTITFPNEEAEVRKEKSKHSESSLRTDRPGKETTEEKSSQKSSSMDHPIQLRRTITRVVPKEEPECHGEKEEVRKEQLKVHNEKEEIRREKLKVHNEKEEIRREKLKTHKEKDEVCREKLKAHNEKDEVCKEKLKVHNEKEEIRREKLKTHKEKDEVHKAKLKAHNEKEEVRKEKPKASKEKEARKEKTEALADTPRLVFLYESDKESDKGDHLEKDPSIGSDFSDIEDMGSLAKFSQEDAPLPSHPMEATTAETSTPSYVMYPPSLYRNPWNRNTDHWPTSPFYKPGAEENKWRQSVLNNSCVSEVSVNAEFSHNMSSDSEGEVETRRWKRSGSFDTSWTFDGKTKTGQRTWENLPDSDTPKFLSGGFIDTHCHLDMLFARLQHRRSFAELREQYASTFPSEFQGCITDYCDPRTLKRLPWHHVLNDNLVWGAFGCHPHFAQYYTSELQEEMMQAMRHPKAIAYGEMGLDYSHKCSTSIPDQHAVFEKQLRLAVPLGKPLVIHCRDADEDLFRIMKKCVPWDYKMHRHCFTGSYKDIEPFINEFPNMSVGYTPVLTYPSAATAREAVTRIPLDRLIIETDAPFFVPRQVPKSLCKFSHPGLALHTVEEIARLKNLPVKSVMAKVRENTHRLYNI